MKSIQLFSLGVGLLCAAVFFQGDCRAVTKDGGYVVYPGGSGPVVFSHESHGIRGAGFACSKCHASSSSKAVTVTMADIRQGKACGSCHDGNIKGQRNQVAAASINDCSACHMPTGDIVIKLNRMDPVAFAHIRHMGADLKQKTVKAIGYSCRDCHPTPFERSAKSPIGMEVPHETGGCASCHNGQIHGNGKKPVFAATTRCLTCHKPQS
jgi:c(7)-type cytochrome triheme protein